VAKVHPVKLINSVSFSVWCSTCDPRGGSEAGSSLHTAFSNVYIRNRMFPACSFVFSRPGRITTTFRFSLSKPTTYCLPLAASAAQSQHVMRSGRVFARHLSVAIKALSAFFRFHFQRLTRKRQSVGPRVYPGLVLRKQSW